MKTFFPFCAAQFAMGFGRWWRSLWALAFVAAVVVGCGGGGGSSSVAGVGSGGTGSFASGSISGFGSIIVNGIRFEESAASIAGTIKDEDGNVGNTTTLKLGMVVKVSGSAISDTGNGPAATATAVTYGSELVGMVESVSLTSRTLVVLGQTVKVTGSTFFDDQLVGGLSALKTGDVVEVYGFYDSDRYLFTATRIEKSNKTEVKLTGEVSNLASPTFSIDGHTISYANISSQIPALVNGTVVRVYGTLKVGVLQATRIRLGQGGSSVAGAVASSDDVRIEGLVTAFSSTVAFSVNGVRVDARNAVVTGVPVTDGAQVEVEGSTTSDDVLVAKKVSVKSSVDVNTAEIRILGAIDNLNPALKTLQVRGVTVDFSDPNVIYDSKKSAADLANTLSIEVRGVLAANGTTVMAKRIIFK